VRPVGRGRRRRPVQGGKREGLSVQGRFGRDVRRVESEVWGRGDAGGGGNEDAVRTWRARARIRVVRGFDPVGRVAGEPDMPGVCTFRGVGECRG
jgi:hypothetical protein